MFKLIKILLAIAIIGMTAYYFYCKYQATHTGESYDSLSATQTYVGQTPDSTEVPDERNESRDAHSNSAELTLHFEDPDKAPYKTFMSAYKNNMMVFKIDAPDGELVFNTDTLIQISMPTQAGTNLSEALFQIEIKHAECNFGEEASWGSINIAGIDYSKGEMSDAGAGQRYNEFYYVWQRDEYCITFSLKMHSVNPGVIEPPPAEFDLDAEVKKIEKLLNTLKNMSGE